MIAAALTLAQPAAPPTPPADDEITIIAQKARIVGVDLATHRRGDRLALDGCRVTRPAGEAEIDAVPCRVAAGCVEDGMPNMRALRTCITNRGLPIIDGIVDRLRAGQP